MVSFGRTAADLRDVDPAESRLTPSRRSGAERTDSRARSHVFGDSTNGMPRDEFYEGPDGVLEIINRVTRDPDRKVGPRQEGPGCGTRKSPPASRSESQSRSPAVITLDFQS
jgi:hypothetical protein